MTTPNFPAYILLVPNSISPTRGAQALVPNAALPGAAVGLIVQLNRDSARHFSGGEGTANISLPVPTLRTIQFGMSYKKVQRARAEFDMNSRYLSDSTIITVPDTRTAAMTYGFAAEESSHGDVRLTVRLQIATTLLQRLPVQNLPIPKIGDLAFLEWPTANDPGFRLSFLDPNSAFHAQAQGIFSQELQAGRGVGAQGGACWLTPGVSPPW